MAIAQGRGRIPAGVRTGRPGAWAGAAAAISVLLASFCLPASVQAAEPLAPAARAAWGFDRSDLTPHPDVRFGVLPNGMRYALLRTAAPSGLSVRLHVAAGAAVEGERRRGFMHLVEHMIFHGSANIPRGALPLMLRHAGLARWTDFDAFTGLDQTVYRLELARADRLSRDTALNLMWEIASQLRFTHANVSGRRGVKQAVRDEIDGRDAVADRIEVARNGFLFPGTPLARGFVGGTKTDVGRAGAKVLERLYRLYYVPRRATLVMVGDFDPATMEAAVAERFSAWRPAGPEGTDPKSAGLSADRHELVRLFVDRRAPAAITFARILPAAGGDDTGSFRDDAFLRTLAVAMLRRRLDAVAGRPDAPFAKAVAADYDFARIAHVASLDLDVRGGDWRRALQAGLAALRDATTAGFTQAELDREAAEMRRAAAEAASAPRTGAALADAIVDAVDRKLVFTAPSGPAATADYLARIRLADVNAAFRAAWGGEMPLIFLSGSAPIAGGEEAVRAAAREAFGR